MMPTLPFIYLIIALTLNDLLTFNKKPAGVKHYVLGLIVFVCSIFAISYFITAFVEPDTRIAAKAFAKNNIPPDSSVLSEIYDLGITPFNSSFGQIELFNFYDLDANIDLSFELDTKLTNSEYIILPSQRILKIRLMDKKKFPRGYEFYISLISGKLGYKRIYASECSIFCRITYLDNPVFRYEQTASVFERPTVMIFQKIRLFAN